MVFDAVEAVSIADFFQPFSNSETKRLASKRSESLLV